MRAMINREPRSTLADGLDPSQTAQQRLVALVQLLMGVALLSEKQHFRGQIRDTKR